MVFRFVWVDRPVREDSDHKTRTVGKEDDDFLTVGGVDYKLLCSNYYKKQDEHGTKDIMLIVTDHILNGKFDVFCVQGISDVVLNLIRKRLRETDPTWKFAVCRVVQDNLMWISHVMCYKGTVLTCLHATRSVLKGDIFFNQVVNCFEAFRSLRLAFEVPVDRSGFSCTFRMVSMKDRFVKILSLALPVLRFERPLENVRQDLFRNLSLKKALFTLFCNPAVPAGLECYYFICGSVTVTECRELRKSSIDKTITAGQLTMIKPEDEFIYFSRTSNATRIIIEELQFYDPEEVVPLRSHGLTSFIYHSKNAVTQAMYKCEMRAYAPEVRRFYDYPCGGRFLLISDLKNSKEPEALLSADREDPKGVEASSVDREVPKGVEASSADREVPKGVEASSVDREVPKGVEASSADREVPKWVESSSADREVPKWVEASSADREVPKWVEASSADREVPKGVEASSADREDPKGVEASSADREDPKGVETSSADREDPNGVEASSADREDPKGGRSSECGP